MEIFQAYKIFAVKTSGPGMVEITRSVQSWLEEVGVQEGAVTLFIRHTSASLTIQENADPDVQKDLISALGRLAPENAGYLHDCEGPDDMPAHIKSALTSTSITIPVLAGKMALGTWQGIYVLEHRTRPHKRQVIFQYMGG